MKRETHLVFGTGRFTLHEIRFTLAATAIKKSRELTDTEAIRLSW